MLAGACAPLDSAIGPRLRDLLQVVVDEPWNPAAACAVPFMIAYPSLAYNILPHRAAV